jgi:hypothetical protein
MKSEPLPWRSNPRALERHVLAVVCIVMLHGVLLSGGAFASAIVVGRSGNSVPGFPMQPLLVLAVALLMAHCSLGAIWWARSNWSPHAKTIVATVSCGGLWLVLITLLETTRHSGVAAAAWAACVATQVTVTGLIAALLELAIHYEAAAARSRFNILYLLVWTSIISVALGIAGAWAARSGFKLGEVPEWGYFQQLQGVGLAGAALALSVYSSVRFLSRWRSRVAACIAAVVATTMTTIASMLAIFGDKAGASITDMIWLFGGEGLFLIATLVPQEIAREFSRKAGFDGA